MEKAEKQTGNPLEAESISKLLLRFAIPSIIAMLVSALYNIVDQFFIGHSVGPLGNAATNIAFPLSMMCTSLALLFGIGGASNFNLAMGAGEREEAPWFVGNAAGMLLGSGTLLCLISELLLAPMLRAFGSPDEVFPYAMEYVRITAIGFPFLISTVGGGHLIRADGKPRMAMLCNLSGALINTVLDALFVMVFGWGMAGAAAATVIGQIFSGFLVFRYLLHYKTVKLKWKHVVPKLRYLKKIFALGMASFFNQLAMMVVQIALNNLLKHYGALSEYGESIPIACAGIVTKVNQVFFSIIIGISQGSQPIEGFNYGAKNYRRVKDTYLLAVKVGILLSVCAFLIFQIFPRQLLGLFGNGDEKYFRFGISYFRIFLAGTLINFLQPMSSTFFTSIGKAYKGMFLSMTRQILFFLPLLFLYPALMGINGILYVGPTADGMAFLAAILLVRREFAEMRKLEESSV